MSNEVGQIPVALPNLNPDTQPKHFELIDVWSRSGPKYRVRAIALLAINILLFAGAASFAYWLRSGEFFAPAREGYWRSIAQTFGGVGNPDVSLAAFLLDPISIHDVPMQIPIVGLLMAAIISIPILVAILYRFWSSIPFILIIGFIAVMPWLAITLLGSCVIASVRPFRTRIRFMSAMLALIPAIVYLILAYSGTRDVVVGRIDPIDRIKFVAPWVLAVVASALLFAIVLAIARIVNYRPGAVTPLLVVMFALPVLLFERHVGRDELYYRLLEHRYHDYFGDKNAGLGLKSAQREWEPPSLSRPARGRFRDVEEESWLFELAADLSRRQGMLTEQQADMAARCASFHHQFPYSQYAPNALFIKATSAGLRLDSREFQRTRWIRYYDDIPDGRSRQTWEIIAENRPDSPMAAVAHLRLAQLDAGSCDCDRALARLQKVINKCERGFAEPGNTADVTLFLSRAPLEAGLGINLEKILMDAAWLRDLIVSNADDEEYRTDPMCGAQRGRSGTPFGLLDLDRRDGMYAPQIDILMTTFPGCKLADNLQLERARVQQNSSEQIAALKAVLEKYPTGDAVPEALVRLALAFNAAGEPHRAAQFFDRVVSEHPNSIWARQCVEQRLQTMPRREVASTQ